MPKKADWEIIDKLGEGGQGTVYKVRKPDRAKRRNESLNQMPFLSNGARFDKLAEAFWTYARPDLDTEVAALKDFDKVRAEGSAAEQRLKREIVVLAQGRPGLPKLLDSSEAEMWTVTEYFPDGSLARHRLRYKGQPVKALRDFRSLVDTVGQLHKNGIIHRDIKPANIFIANEGKLILGDFGIVFMLDESHRPTLDEERVGPRDFMAPWVDLGKRVEDVKPCSDVYMLGKLLWCMVSGEVKLPREYHRRADFDLTKRFRDTSPMRLVNFILDACLVEDSAKCLPSANELLDLVDKALSIIEKDLPLLDENGLLDMRCRMCGRGTYRSIDGRLHLARSHETGSAMDQVLLRGFCCDVCAHYAFFALGYPEDAAKRAWKPRS